MASKVKERGGAVAATAQSANPPAYKPLISDAKLKNLYAAMLRSRILDERARELRPSSERLSTAKADHGGGEAVVAGTAIDLRRDDWLAPSRADLFGKLLKGVPLQAIVAELLRGDSVADSASHATVPWRILPNAPDPAAQLNLAAGVALGLRDKPRGSVAMGFCGDIPPETPGWHEALAFAAQHCLPLLIVTEVKFPARTASANAKPPSGIPAKGKSSPRVLVEGQVRGVPVIPVDAHDIVAIYRVAYESIHKARHGGGPTLIEATTLPPNLTGKPGTGSETKPSDATAKMEDYLAAKGLFSPSWKQKFVEDFTLELDAAVRAAKKKAGKKK